MELDEVIFKKCEDMNTEEMEETRKYREALTDTIGNLYNKDFGS